MTAGAVFWGKVASGKEVTAGEAYNGIRIRGEPLDKSQSCLFRGLRSLGFPGEKRKYYKTRWFWIF